MMRRAALVAGIAVALSGLVASADAGGGKEKRLPKPASSLDSKQGDHISFFVKGSKQTPAAASSGALRETKPFTASHSVREMR
jgi:hypothetical protein